MPLKAKTLHNSVKVPAHEHVVCIHCNLYMTCRVTEHMWVSTYMFSCRLTLVPASEGLCKGHSLWAPTLFLVYFFFLLSAYSLCLVLYFTNYVVACLCVPAVSLLCMSAFFRSLHTSNKFWSAYVLLCVFLFVYLWIFVHGNTCVCICENFSIKYM